MTDRIEAEHEGRSAVVELARDRLPETGTVGEILSDRLSVHPDEPFDRARERAAALRETLDRATGAVDGEGDPEPLSAVRADAIRIGESVTDGEVDAATLAEALDRTERIRENLGRAVDEEMIRRAEVRDDVLGFADRRWRAETDGLDPADIDHDDPSEHLPENPPLVGEVFTDLLGTPALELRAEVEHAESGHGVEPDR